MEWVPHGFHDPKMWGIKTKNGIILLTPPKTTPRRPIPCHLERNVLHFAIAILTQDRQRGGHRTTNFSHRPRVEAMPPPEFPDPPPHDKEWFHGDPVDIGMQLGVRYPPSIKANIFLNLSTKKQSIAWYGSSFLSHALEL